MTHESLNSQSGARSSVSQNKLSVVVGIGEVLWDCFPDDRKLGGAPFNFSFHCNQLGVRAFPVSAVGNDQAGADIRNQMAFNHLADDYVQTDLNHATGKVLVSITDGTPRYEICPDAAWDYIQMNDPLLELASNVSAVCFGSLCQRNQVSRATIYSFLDALKPETIKIFDVNLRQNFYSKAMIEDSLQRSTVLKLNDEELPVLAQMFSLRGSIPEQLCLLIRLFPLKLVALTRGGEGAMLITADQREELAGFPTQVVDTVGAGDAFTAVLCAGLLNHQPLPEMIQDACRVAAFVCTQTGATPFLHPTIRSSFLSSTRFGD